MQQARIIPKTYQRKQYPAFEISKDTIDYKRVQRVSNNSVTVWSDAKKFLNNIQGYCCQIDNFYKLFTTYVDLALRKMVTSVLILYLKYTPF